MKKLTPMKAIRARCIDCSGYELAEVRKCNHSECPLHPYRSGHRPKEKAPLTPVKSIRKYCVEICCCGSAKEVRLCPSENCVLFSYRFGKRALNDVSIEKVITDEKSLDSTQFFSKEGDSE